MKTRIAGVALAAVVACGWASGAEAAYIVNIDEVGGNVVVTGSGSLDLSGLSFQGTGGSSFQYISPSSAFIAIGSGPLLDNFDGYTGLSGPSSFGEYRPTFLQFASSSGPAFVLYGSQGILGVDAGFRGGNYGPTTATFDNTFLYGLGLMPNQTFTYRLGSAVNADTVTIVTGSTVGPVPLPASAPLFGVALVALAGIGWTARRRAA